MVRPLRFAVQVARAASGAEWLDLARRVEALGYGTLSMPDHVVGEAFAPFPALAAAAVVTSRIRVGHLVLNNDFRNPLLLAREALTLDALSGGRLELGLGAGWLERDYEGLGLSFDRPGVRIARLAETVTLLKRLFTEEEVTFEGRFYRLTRAREGATLEATVDHLLRRERSKAFSSTMRCHGRPSASVVARKCSKSKVRTAADVVSARAITDASTIPRSRSAYRSSISTALAKAASVSGVRRSSPERSAARKRPAAIG